MFIFFRFVEIWMKNWSGLFACRIILVKYRITAAAPDTNFGANTFASHLLSVVRLELKVIIAVIWSDFKFLHKNSYHDQTFLIANHCILSHISAFTIHCDIFIIAVSDIYKVKYKCDGYTEDLPLELLRPV